MLPTLLYGSETWTVKAKIASRLRGLQKCCIRAIMGVSRLHVQQWKEMIMARELAESIGMMESMTDVLRRPRL